jgi:hypothetical protein
MRLLTGNCSAAIRSLNTLRPSVLAAKGGDPVGGFLQVKKVRRWLLLPSRNKPDSVLVLDTFVIDAAISFTLTGTKTSGLDAWFVLGVGVC